MVSPFVMYVLLPIIGVVIGAALNYLFTKFLEERRHRQNLKTQAYVDFTRDFMDASIKGLTNENISHLKNAIQRIAIYGDKEVVEAIADIMDFIANYMNKAEEMPEPEYRRLYTALIQAMRKKNVPPKERVSDKEMSLAIHGPD